MKRDIYRVTDKMTVEEGKWYTVMICTANIFDVIRKIEETIGKDNVFYPVCKKEVIKKGQITYVDTLPWSQYIIVKNVDYNKFIEIRDRFNLKIFFEESYTDEYIEKLREKYKDLVDKIVPSINVKEGDPIRIRDGLFVGMLGNVVTIDKKKNIAKVKIKMFNRDSDVEVPLSSIELLK